MTTKLCPLLSLASLSKEPSPIVASIGAPPSAPSATACVEEKCAWWLAQTDENGKVVGGGCAITAQPAMTAQSAMANAAFANALNEVLRQLKIRPRTP